MIFDLSFGSVGLDRPAGQNISAPEPGSAAPDIH